MDRLNVFSCVACVQKAGPDADAKWDLSMLVEHYAKKHMDAFHLYKCPMCNHHMASAFYASYHMQQGKCSGINRTVTQASEYTVPLLNISFPDLYTLQKAINDSIKISLDRIIAGAVAPSATSNMDVVERGMQTEDSSVTRSCQTDVSSHDSLEPTNEVRPTNSDSMQSVFGAVAQEVFSSCTNLNLFSPVDNSNYGFSSDEPRGNSSLDGSVCSLPVCTPLRVNIPFSTTNRKILVKAEPMSPVADKQNDTPPASLPPPTSNRDATFNAKLVIKREPPSLPHPLIGDCASGNDMMRYSENGQLNSTEMVLMSKRPESPAIEGASDTGHSLLEKVVKLPSSLPPLDQSLPLSETPSQSNSRQPAPRNMSVPPRVPKLYISRDRRTSGNNSGSDNCSAPPKKYHKDLDAVLDALKEKCREREKEKMEHVVVVEPGVNIKKRGRKKKESLTEVPTPSVTSSPAARSSTCSPCTTPVSSQTIPSRCVPLREPLLGRSCSVAPHSSVIDSSSSIQPKNVISAPETRRRRWDICVPDSQTVGGRGIVALGGAPPRKRKTLLPGLLDPLGNPLDRIIGAMDGAPASTESAPLTIPNLDPYSDSSASSSFSNLHTAISPDASCESMMSGSHETQQSRVGYFFNNPYTSTYNIRLAEARRHSMSVMTSMIYNSLVGPVPDDSGSSSHSSMPPPQPVPPPPPIPTSRKGSLLNIPSLSPAASSLACTSVVADKDGVPPLTAVSNAISTGEEDMDICTESTENPPTPSQVGRDISDSAVLTINGVVGVESQMQLVVPEKSSPGQPPEVPIVATEDLAETNIIVDEDDFDMSKALVIDEDLIEMDSHSVSSQELIVAAPEANEDDEREAKKMEKKKKNKEKEEDIRVEKAHRRKRVVLSDSDCDDGDTRDSAVERRGSHSHKRDKTKKSKKEGRESRTEKSGSAHGKKTKDKRSSGGGGAAVVDDIMGLMNDTIDRLSRPTSNTPTKKSKHHHHQ